MLVDSCASSSASASASPVPPIDFAPSTIECNAPNSSIRFPSDEPWLSLLITPCGFAPLHFQYVMDNLLRNPNLTSSCLFRADILYDSEKDPDANLEDENASIEGLLKYMKPELLPIPQASLDGYSKQRVVVRNLVPRNPSLDKELVQTVWILAKTKILPNASITTPEEEHNLVIYIPHANDPDSIPYYHPKVHSLALLHTFRSASHTGSLSIHYRIFPTSMSSRTATPASDSPQNQPSISKRLQRTALNLLRIIHKHANGQQAGYKKRVHHDLLVDQVTFQDTYVRLKQKYAKPLLETWVEVTDPKKHVFEDIGIAAFLIEIWKGMYGNNNRKSNSTLCGLVKSGSDFKSNGFPGFVDIGCGNGVLVYILLSEGYEGWGFDVRRRKSWSVFPEFVQEQLKELVLIPEVLRLAAGNSEKLAFLDTAGTHNGIFSSGTFIVSNHADQLTPWTPLLAYSSNSPFISIPCCSHALNGKLSRFYDVIPAPSGSSVSKESVSSKSSIATDRSGASDEKSLDNLQFNPLGDVVPDGPPEVTHTAPRPIDEIGPGPRTGSLARNTAKKVPMPSAYSGFTAYVVRIATALDFKVESEVLRIPSTRNHSIVSRQPPIGASDSQQKRDEKVLALLKQEIEDISVAAREWIEGAVSIKRKAGGH